MNQLEMSVSANGVGCPIESNFVPNERLASSVSTEEHSMLQMNDAKCPDHVQVPSTEQCDDKEIISSKKNPGGGKEPIVSNSGCFPEPKKFASPKSLPSSSSNVKVKNKNKYS